MSHALKHIPFELKGDDEPSPSDLVQKAIDNFHGVVDTRLKQIEEKSLDASKIIDRLSKLEAKANRPGSFANDNVDPEDKLERKAFREYLRKGDALGAEEVKSLRVSDNTSGGYLAPKQIETTVLTNLILFSPVRTAAAVGNTSAGSVVLPKETGEINAYWTGETEERTETDTSFGQLEIVNHELATFVDVSIKLLEDSAVDIESFVGQRLGKKFGQIEAQAFVNGDGVKRPAGFMLDPDIGYTPSGDAALVLDTALNNAFYKLAPPYRNVGVWMMNGTTIAAVRNMKDTTGRFIWQQALVAGQPDTLLGRPLVEAIDMPDIAGNAFPIIYGDFKTAYQIYDRVGLDIFVDPYTQRLKGNVRIHARRRVGAGVIVAAALNKLKIATA